MKKKLIIVVGVLILIVGSIFIVKKVFFKKDLKETKDVYVVPTMQDEIAKDASWCATFELVWNDMKNEVVKKDIVFNPEEEFVKNLNKEEFTEDMLSDEYYYKAYGLKTLELKKQIEKGIKEKFNQTSDILDNFDWSEDSLNDPNDSSIDRYFFYTMLYREFEFINKFDKLENSSFGKYNDIKYFGIDKNTKEEVKDQVEVLYYNSKDDFAIKINTKNNDEIILNKNPKGNNFKEIYDNIENLKNRYNENNSLNDSDELKVPYLDFKIIRDYTELENKKFPTYNGVGEIMKAIQSIEFSLDEKGGKIKSEAGIDMENYMTAVEDETRYFYLDDTFAIFLREKGKDMPYFAGRIEDITKFQQ